MLGLNVPVGQLREAVELALVMLPKLKAERAHAVKTAGVLRCDARLERGADKPTDGVSA